MMRSDDADYIRQPCILGRLWPTSDSLSLYLAMPITSQLSIRAEEPR